LIPNRLTAVETNVGVANGRRTSFISNSKLFPSDRYYGTGVPLRETNAEIQVMIRQKLHMYLIRYFIIIIMLLNRELLISESIGHPIVAY
jgi:hypothetical protein